MSNSLAIGCVTAALQQLLGAVAAPLPGDPSPDPDLADAFVTCKALDAARSHGDEAKNQLNLFLFQVLPDAAFRNMDMQGRVNSGETANQPVALNLYYVLTAYGANHDDVLAHRMLGRAMSILNDNSTLPRVLLQAALPGSDLYLQLERVRIRPAPLGMEEISKLWTGFSKPYRISIAYEVTVVLIQSTDPVVSPVPVLTRGYPVMVNGKKVEPGPSVQPNLTLPYPVLTDFTTPTGGPSIRMGEVLTITGENLGGTSIVAHFDHPLLATVQNPTPITGWTPTQFSVTIPSSPTVWPAGTYAVTVDVKTDQVRTTNVLSVPLAPTIQHIKVVSSSAAQAVIEIDFIPDAWPQQTVALIIEDQQVLAGAHAQTGTLQFTVNNPPQGPHLWVRLRVDGVDSLLLENYALAVNGFDTTDPTKFVSLP